MDKNSRAITYYSNCHFKEKVMIHKDTTTKQLEKLSCTTPEVKLGGKNMKSAAINWFKELKKTMPK